MTIILFSMNFRNLNGFLEILKEIENRARYWASLGAAVFLIDGGALWPTAVVRGPAAPGDQGGSEGHEELVGNMAGATLTG
jgi:hypothetical protein